MTFITVWNPNNVAFWKWFCLVYFVFEYLEIYPEIQYFYTLLYRDVSRTPQHLRQSSGAFIKNNSISDAAGLLDPPLILIQKSLISYISRLFCSIKIVKSRRPRFEFCYFRRPFFVTSVSYISHSRSSLKTCSATKVNLKFPIISKFEILTKYLEYTFKRFHLL